MKIKKILTFAVVVATMAFSQSCDKSKSKVEELSKQFISAVNGKDKATIYNLYPDAKNLANMTIPESIIEGEMTIEKNDSGQYVVSIANPRQQKFVFVVKSENDITIHDTYGVLDLDSMSMELALKTGVPVKQLSDLALARLMEPEGAFLNYIKDVHSQYLGGQLTFDSGTWNASRAYGGSVNVTQPIRNNGEVPIKGSEYNVEFEFYTPNGTASGRQKIVEEGVDLQPGESYTYNINPNSGYVNACYEHDFDWHISFAYKNQSPVENLLKYAKFTGKEYEEYLESKPSATSSNPSAGKDLNLSLTGFIGDGTDAAFNYNGQSDEGTVSFTSNGAYNQRMLKLGAYDATTGKLVMNEFFSNGNYIGDFVGTYSGGVYEGTFTNKNSGGQVQFRLD